MNVSNYPAAEKCSVKHSQRQYKTNLLFRLLITLHYSLGFCTVVNDKVITFKQKIQKVLYERIWLVWWILLQRILALRASELLQCSTLYCSRPAFTTVFASESSVQYIYNRLSVEENKDSSHQDRQISIPSSQDMPTESALCVSVWYLFSAGS